MKKVILLLMLVFFAGFVAAAQPTQQFNKIYLEPFYRVSLSSGVNVTYNVTVNPPDKISNVVAAILSFNIQVNGQTQTLTAWVNGRSCKNPTYSIATAFSTTGQLQAYFDCSNVINASGKYNVTLQSAVNTGAISGWLDITYMNNPKGDQGLTVHGTEYIEGDDATVFLQLRDADGIPITNGLCYMSLYWPATYNISHPKFVNEALMLYLSNGIFYYDFTAPSFPGLYMTDARCSYTLTNDFYYPPESPLSPKRTIIAGTFTGDTQVLNDKSDALYTKCDSVGNPKTCDSYLEWKIDKNATQTFDLNVVYLGEATVAATLTMYYWNWTSGAWVALPNTLVFKSTATSAGASGVDEYLANNIPVSNQTINESANNSVRIRFYASAGSSFSQFNNYANLVVSHTTSSVQDLRGSGEVHISSPQVNAETRFYRIESCDGFSDGRCGIFTNDDEFDLAEGEIEDWLNISAVSTQGDTSITYNSPFSIDCTSLYWIKEWNGTAWVDFEDYMLYSQPSLENCQITLTINLQAGDFYQYWFKFDNYMVWEEDWTKAMGDSVYVSSQSLCANRNYTYVNPVTESTVRPNDLTTNFCLELYDDIYWMNSYYNDSLLVDVAGEYASYVQEMRFYRESMYQRYMYLTLGNTTSNMAEYYAKKHWEYANRTVLNNQQFIGGTEYSTLEATGRIAARVMDNAGNPVNGASCNLSIFYPATETVYKNVIMTIPVGQVNGIYYYDFNQSGRTGVHVYTIDCTKLGQRYFMMGTYHVFDNNVSQIADAIWTAPTRNLTYYPPMVVDVASIWSYSNRTLTYYADMTNYTYIFNKLDLIFGDYLGVQMETKS